MKFMTIAIFILLLLLIAGGAICYFRLAGDTTTNTAKTMILERIARQQSAATPLEECVTAALQNSRAGKIAFQNYYDNITNERPERWLYQLILIGQTAALFDADVPAFYPETRARYLQVATTDTEVRSQMAFYAYTRNDRELARKILDELPYYSDFHPYKSNLADKLLRQATNNDDIVFVIHAINNSRPDVWRRAGNLLFYTPMLTFMLIKKYLLWLWAITAAVIVVKVMICIYKHSGNSAKSNCRGGYHG